MVGFWIRGAQGAVKGVKALSKMKGQKTVGQVKLDAAKSKLKMAKDALKEGPKVIKAIKPYAKIVGAKSVLDVKNLASAARVKAAGFGYKEGIKKAMKKMKDIK